MELSGTCIYMYRDCNSKLTTLCPMYDATCGWAYSAAKHKKWTNNKTPLFHLKSSLMITYQEEIMNKFRN